MEIIVRDAKLTDAEAIYHFINELEGKVFGKERFLAFFHRIMEDVRNYYLLAIDGDEAVGFLSCHGQNLLHHLDTVYEIQEMYVTDQYRSRGVGQKLIEALDERLKDKQYDVVEVSSNIKRTAAHAFYVRHGFEHTHLKFVRKRQTR